MGADIVATNMAVLLTDTKIARETAGDDGEGPGSTSFSASTTA